MRDCSTTATTPFSSGSRRTSWRLENVTHSHESPRIWPFTNAHTYARAHTRARHRTTRCFFVLFLAATQVDGWCAPRYLPRLRTGSENSTAWSSCIRRRWRISAQRRTTNLQIDRLPPPARHCSHRELVAVRQGQGTRRESRAIRAPSCARFNEKHRVEQQIPLVPIIKKWNLKAWYTRNWFTIVPNVLPKIFSEIISNDLKIFYIISYSETSIDTLR